ncbi:hypothetical protein [Collimonas sp. OK607]|uniref:hypothetical protein n=1 Tax=Collimonas sp. OK607 TaxID=1798194 RepID=UPI00147D113B|nr:hypothetical protein [Collimonas sp. OK607]
MKQNLPAKGLLQRDIGTMLKVWTQTEKINPQQLKKGEYHETIANIRASGRLYFAGSKLDQLFATGRIVLTIANWFCTCQLQDEQQSFMRTRHWALIIIAPCRSGAHPLKISAANQGLLACAQAHSLLP